MRRSLFVIAVLSTLMPAAALAAPEVSVTKVPLAEMTMNPDNALSQRPFELEGKCMYWYRGLHMPAPFALTDATSSTTPADNATIDGSEPPSWRFDLGRPAVERELRKIVVWWGLADPARCGINLKFQVHDFTTGEWRNATDFVRQDLPREEGMAGCLTLTFPEGEFKNFDSLRMIDGRRLFKAPGTRWIEVEAYTAPDNK
ncbi:MAG: hypothetical protein GX100_07910 [candidate division WS1 bacterium]|nr:hypothetical protein [candidate division WS1 bacterium]